MAILVNLLNMVIIKKSRDHKKSSDFDKSGDYEKLGNSCYSGNFDEPYKYYTNEYLYGKIFKYTSIFITKF